MQVPALPVPAVRWWAGKSSAERRVVLVVAALVVAAIGWLGIWQPMTRDVASMRVERSHDNAALAEARRMADEIAGLARAGAVSAPGDPRSDVERVLAAHGLREQATQLDLQEGRVRIVFAAVAFARLVPALEALQREARLRLVEATLTARVETGSVRAELALSR